MKPIAPPADSKLGMLEARLRFWLTIPNATGMHAKIEAEIAAHRRFIGPAHSVGSMNANPLPKTNLQGQAEP